MSGSRWGAGFAAVSRFVAEIEAAAAGQLDAAPGRYVRLSVADNGTGMTEELRRKIFEPFFSTKGQKGTGLGLSVIWGIIDNHNGTINVESTLNKGTTFRIRLPLQQPR